LTLEHERKSFLFYGSYLDAVERLKDKDVKLELMLAIAHYGLDRKVPKFSNDLAAMAWVFIEPLLDANYKNYINGSKGGAPTGNQNAKKQPKNNPKTTEKQPKNNPKQGNVNDNDNVNDNANDNATDNDNANDNDNDNVNDNIENSIFPTDEEKVTDDDFYEIWQRDDGVWMGGDIPMEERLKMEKEGQQNV